MTAGAIPGVMRALWVGAGIEVAGLLYDLRWHAAHDHFETGADQVEAHWLAWTGLVVLLVVAFSALLRLPASQRPSGLVVVAAAASARAAVTVWHFWEHLNERDPALPHVLLAVSEVTMFAGVVLVALQVRRLEQSRAASRA